MTMVHMGRIHFQSVHRNKPSSVNPRSRQTVPRKVALDSSDAKKTEKCRGCGKQIHQIRKHLAWKPQCKPFYPQEELDAASAATRKDTKESIDSSQQKRMQAKKVQQSQANHAQQVQPLEKIVISKKNHKLKPPADKFCSVCEKIFNRPDELTRHLREVHGMSRLSCPACAITFTRKESLQRHIEAIHLQSQQKCSICEQVFSNKDSLTRHIHDVHEAVKKFKCPDCPLMFARKDTLDKHVKSAQANWRRHGVEFHCNICGKDFVFLSHSACSTHVFKKGDKLTCKTKEAER